jgi:hypothetical protein
MKFLVYSLTTGKINKSINCDNNIIDTQFDKNTENAIASEFDVNYGFFDFNTNNFAPFPLKPNGSYYFDYITKQWVQDQPAQESVIKAQRNQLLQQSDWTQIPNTPLTAEQQQAWADYRQQLRDITSQSGYPFNVVWPTPPQG